MSGKQARGKDISTSFLPLHYSTEVLPGISMHVSGIKSIAFVDMDNNLFWVAHFIVLGQIKSGVVLIIGKSTLKCCWNELVKLGASGTLFMLRSLRWIRHCLSQTCYLRLTPLRGKAEYGWLTWVLWDYLKPMTSSCRAIHICKLISMLSLT